METIILIAALAFLFVLVYWKNVGREPREHKTPQPQLIEVEAKIEFFSEEDGWNAVFHKDGVLCYGVFLNLSKGQVTKGVTIPAFIEEEPTADNEFYLLRA